MHDANECSRTCHVLCDACRYIQIQRLPHAAWLLGAVQHSDSPGAGRQCGQQVLRGPGAEQVHLQQQQQQQQQQVAKKKQEFCRAVASKS
jgi:hypothetical protein